jgi:hypothetical protein
VNALVARAAFGLDPEVLAASLLGQYSPDAIIQAAQDVLGADDATFREILSEELYRGLRETLTREQFEVFCDILASDRPGTARVANWLTFLDVVRTQYAQCSSLALASIIEGAIEAGRAPSAVISFNAEPLLLALTNALSVERFAQRAHILPQAGDRKMVFDYVTHSISRRRVDRIPYVFCHGLLPVPDPAGREDRHDGSDKLVFSETEYLQLANTSYSWQSSVFLQAASTQHIVFVGVSLTDANMRRWLSWAHSTRLSELAQAGHEPGPSTAHYWVARRPGTEGEKHWVESTLAHLGVRAVWLNSWDQLGATFSRLLAT